MPCDPTTNARRTRLPSDLKFLLNERAAAAGEVRALDVACSELNGRLLKLELAAAKVRTTLDRARASRTAQVAQVDALELVLRHIHPDIDPSGVHVVKAWAGKYGPRGALRDFIHQTVQNVQPGGVRARVIRAAAIAHFGLKLETKRDLESFRATVKVQLTRSCAQGLIDFRPGGSRGAREWFWNAGPTGAQLLAIAAAAGDQDDHQEPHTLRAEVGG
jgi:hypothetical protein